MAHRKVTTALIFVRPVMGVAVFLCDWRRDVNMSDRRMGYDDFDAGPPKKNRKYLTMQQRRRNVWRRKERRGW